MVLVNELRNPFSLGLSCIGEALTVGFVWLAQIEMVGRLLDIDGHRLVVKGESNAARVPWIKLTVTENNVRCLREILLGMQTAEVLESPVIPPYDSPFEGWLEG